MSISAIGLAPSAESSIRSRTVITSSISAASNDTLPALDETIEPVIAGPFPLFDGSFIIEFLQPAPWRSASVLMRGTYKMNHPLWKQNPERHPQLPPLHLHFDQAETIQVLQGTLSCTLDYAQRIVHVCAGAQTVIEPLTPHIVGPPIADLKDPDSDVVILVWAHPDNRPGHMDLRFFLNLFMHVSDAQAGKSNLDLGRVMLMQQENDAALVMFPSAWWLGSLRWRIPYLIQAVVAAVARAMGKTALTENYNKMARD